MLRGLPRGILQGLGITKGYPIGFYRANGIEPGTVYIYIYIYMYTHTCVWSKGSRASIMSGVRIRGILGPP